MWTAHPWHLLASLPPFPGTPRQAPHAPAAGSDGGPQDAAPSPCPAWGLGFLLNRFSMGCASPVAHPEGVTLFWHLECIEEIGMTLHNTACVSCQWTEDHFARCLQPFLSLASPQPRAPCGWCLISVPSTPRLTSS